MVRASLTVVHSLLLAQGLAETMTQECTSCEECDWDGLDSKDRAGLAGGGHAATACTAACLSEPLCKYAALSSSGYCHLFASCTGRGPMPDHWARWRRSSAPPAPAPVPPPTPFPFPTALPSHPRLRLDSAALGRLSDLIANDEQAAIKHKHVVAKAEDLLTKEPVKYDHTGVEKSLLNTARMVVDRIYTLGLVYRLSGDSRFAARAATEMLAVAQFPDWNPSHFLDTAEMLHGMAIGYDWTYDALSSQDQKSIVAGAERLGFAVYLTNTSKSNPWQRPNWNWNQVVNGAFVAAALAFGDSQDAPSAPRAFDVATMALPNAFGSYAPAGAWPEGPGYWGYGTRYALVASDSMFSATGVDLGWAESEGFDETGFFCIYNSGPSSPSNLYNWADCGASKCDSANLFYLAGRFPKFEAVYGFFARSVMGSGSGLELAGYTAAGGEADLAALPTSKYFESSETSVGFFRSEWNNENASWVGFKGCTGQASHGDLDGGSFVLEMGAQRWAIDLGSDNYGLPNYWRKGTKDGERFSYYRKSTRGHNTLTFGGSDARPGTSGQDVNVFTKVSHFDADGSFALIDMTAAYAPQGLSRCVRGIAFVAGFRQLLVVDEFEFEGTPPANLTWALHTEAALSTDGPTATLLQGGQTLHARVKGGGATLDFGSVEVRIPEPQNPSPNLRKLVVETTPEAAAGRLVVALSLDETLALPDVNPLREWASRGPVASALLV